MNRKQFIESLGATCDNWTWSWSFVNHKDRVVIFGAWDTHTNGNMALIFSEEWKINSKGRKPPGYDQSLGHIRLIEQEGYKLKTFPMKYSDANKDENDVGPSKIESFTPRARRKYLRRVGNGWYASDGKISIQIPEEVDESEKFIVGASKIILVNSFERDPIARRKCLSHHGFKCSVCSFDFEEFYGPIGQSYIHVHHIVPFSEIKKKYSLDPIKDLVPVCPNCHAMIHRTRPIWTVANLKELLQAKRDRSQ